MLSVLLTACAIPPEERAGAPGATATGVAGHDHPMAPLSEMPADVRAADARTREAYRFAVANRAAAEQVPCYCGCVGLGHVSSYDCYVAETRADGTLAFDSHAVNCTVCVDITQDQMWLLDGGSSPEMIRAYIDRHYAAYGPPTPLTSGDAGEALPMSEH